MISKDEYLKAKSIIKQYEAEQKRLRKLKKTSIPTNEWILHRQQCCFEHGCKFDKNDCPVVVGIIMQNQKCEKCYLEKDNN